MGLGTFAGADSAPIDQLDVTAHRGDGGGYPENSIPALQSAMESGARSLQVDVIMTKDMELILHREYVIYPADFSGAPVFFNVGSVPLEKIRTLRHPRRGTQVPTLGELFQILTSDPRRQDVQVRLELQSKDVFSRQPLVDQVASLVERYNMAERVIVTSYDWPLIAAFKETFPGLKRGLMISKRGSSSYWRYHLQSLRSIFEAYRPTEVSPHYEMVSEAMIRGFSKFGVQVRPYEVNSDSDARALQRIGVRGVISDFPRILLPTPLDTSCETVLRRASN